MSSEISLGSELDIASLLQPRQGFLWKLGGGQEKGSKWNKRWFVLRDNVLMYFNSPKDFTSFRDKPSGVVLLEECNVRSGGDGAVGAKYTFVLAHTNGESVVLAAETEKEMFEWMQAVRTSRMCVTDAEAAAMPESMRRMSAEKDLESAETSRAGAQKVLKDIEMELETVQDDHRRVEIEKEKAEKDLKELMARFKLRKALLHWRHRKLTLSFRALVTMVFHHRIDQAKKLKADADEKLARMTAEAEASLSARQKAEAAKRKSEEMLSRELALKKEGENDEREMQKTLVLEAEKTQMAVSAVQQLQSAAADVQFKGADAKDKSDAVAVQAELLRAKAEIELLQLQLKRKAITKAPTK